MNNKYDIAIIGSGLGGLVCGYILSKKGFKVAIFEKNSQIGGCLQSFSRFGVKFDTGMHYVGSMQPGQILHRLFNFLNLHKDVQVERLDPQAYDIVTLNGKKYSFAMGYEAFVDSMHKSFPNERKSLEEFVKRIRQIADSSPLYNLKETNNLTFIDSDFIKTSVNDFIASITQNPLLQNVLVANLPLYAGVKDKTPTYIYALITNFYIQSAYRIVGGSDAIANSLSSSIQKHGGEVFTQAKVNKILCNDKQATGIELENGEIIEVNSVISNVHPTETLQMLDTPLIRKAYRERVLNLENTISNFTLYIKFKENKQPYLNSNFYHYDNEDVWNSLNYRKDVYPESYLFMHQCHETSPKFAQSGEMIGYMNFEEVAKWENTFVAHRGDEYKAFKQYKAQQMIDKLEQSFPGIKQNIENYETSTPLTYRDYTATHRGSMYGVLRDKNSPTQTLVSQRTKIPNLFMTGQNINSHGILGVMIGAIITSAEFVGLNTIIKEVEKFRITY